MTLGHGLLLVDKPAGITSHDVVAMTRRALSTRRVGHAGTLDPMATGLLVLGVGEGLKVLRYLAADEKCYRAEITLGAETDTLDADGVVTEHAPFTMPIDRAEVERVAATFVGRSVQRAPVVSALKRDGVPLHARARRGESVEAPEREVEVMRIDVLRVEADRIELEVECGKGFYVRALARDLGRALGTRAHLSVLRRLRSGNHGVEDAVSAEALRAAFADEPGARTALRARVGDLVSSLDAPVIVLDEAGADDAHHGRRVTREHIVEGVWPEVPTEPLWLVTRGRAPLALARSDGEALHVVRGMRL